MDRGGQARVAGPPPFGGRGVAREMAPLVRADSCADEDKPQARLDVPSPAGADMRPSGGAPASS